MCGLSGAAGSLNWKEERTARDLLFYNTLRGEDSTGIATLQKGNHSHPEIAKAMGPPWYLLDTKKYEKAIKGSLAFIMNHNRKATVGAKSLNNAHPFQFGSVVGMHNGTIPDHLLRGLPDFDYMDTDSQCLISSIAEVGVEKTMKLIPENAVGAYALVWFDQKDRSINFLRNSQRSLYFTFDEDRKNLFWSSEIEHLISATNRNEIARSKSETAFGFIPMKHYKLILPEAGKSFGPFQYSPIEHGPRPVYNNNSGGSGSRERPFPSAVEGTQSTTTNSQTTGHTDTGINERSGQCEISFKETSTSKKNSLPTDAVIRMLKNGKDKFACFYKDDNCRIYFDGSVGSYHRYWWSEKEIKWSHAELPSKPIEVQQIDDKEIVRLIQEKKVRIGSPFGKQLIRPTSQPQINTEEEVIYQSGTSVIVCKYKMSDGHPKPWIVYRWLVYGKNWSRTESLLPPKELMDNQCDIRSDHSFQWRGKKEKRRALYKGFNRKELTRDEFNKITGCGCLACSRTPQWTLGRRGGVKIHFITADSFICEYCAMNKETLATARSLATEDKGKTEDNPTIN